MLKYEKDEFIIKPVSEKSVPFFNTSKVADVQIDDIPQKTI